MSDICKGCQADLHRDCADEVPVWSVRASLHTTCGCAHHLHHESHYVDGQWQPVGSVNPLVAAERAGSVGPS